MSLSIRRGLRAVRSRVFGGHVVTSRDGRFSLSRQPDTSCVLLIDRLTRIRYEFHVRGNMDHYTLLEIFIHGAYDFSGLRRWSDIDAYYQGLVATGKHPLILDCGANIGASSLYFAIRFPEAHVLAIEPEAGNAAQHRTNCSLGNVELLQAAVGPQRGTVSLEPNQNPRAHRVRPGGAGLAIEMVGIEQLLEERPDKAPFLAKIDIEGFEHELFTGPRAWIDRFALIAVEPHDWMMPGQAKARSMLAAFAPTDRDFVIHGENVVSIKNAL